MKVTGAFHKKLPEQLPFIIGTQKPLLQEILADSEQFVSTTTTKTTIFKLSRRTISMVKNNECVLSSSKQKQIQPYSMAQSYKTRTLILELNPLYFPGKIQYKIEMFIRLIQNVLVFIKKVYCLPHELYFSLL